MSKKKNISCEADEKKDQDIPAEELPAESDETGQDEPEKVDPMQHHVLSYENQQ